MTTLTADELARIVDEHNRTGAGWGSVQALLEHIATEQSRIDAAVAKERERCAEIARARANTFTADTSGDYRDGEHIAAREIEKAIRTPTPTTEEGA